MIKFDFSKTDIFQNKQCLSYEWLDTNGLGGWASATFCGCNSRRYHGLLIAATNPPTERMVLVSKLDETIVTADKRFELGVNNYGDVKVPEGDQYLHSFTKDLYPVFTYHTEEVILQKSILMIQGENTTILKYDVLQASQPFTLELLPLLAVRNIHELTHANDSIHKDISFNDGILKTKLYEGTPDILMQLNNSSFQSAPDWYYNFNYELEKYRGLDYKEDLYTPGKFYVKLKEGDTYLIILSTQDVANRDAATLFNAEVQRRNNLVEVFGRNESLRQLAVAADQFIVKRDFLKTIIAGYHWFTDWSRDTMISLPGLCLSTHRFEDAKKILAAFARSVDKGMLPNRFTDNGDIPEYNNVDGTLWYFVAVYKYLKATGDQGFVLKELLPVLKDVIGHHYAGTRYNIHVDEDELLFAGEPGVQLTWMDAKIGDWVVTPRTGKPVEVQALWYNALCIYSQLLRLDKQVNLANLIKAKAQVAKGHFLSKFWYHEGDYLYDVIDANGQPDTSLRPNQLLALSLPYPLVDGEKAESVLSIIEQRLYTPKGIRSLSPGEEQYTPHYGGSQYQRDAAYHQGAVWSWLVGPYIDAIMAQPDYVGLDGLKGKKKAQKIVDVFLEHLEEGCIGSVSEIFDAEPPHHARGCVAQAWGVGEVLRVIHDYKLIRSKNSKKSTAVTKRADALP
jgi:predicted glycogen debranching enzyme